MHRLIVTSATYRQSSRARPELAGVDPHNKFLARQNRLRLDAEIVRDSALAVSGRLSEKFGGPSVHPPQPKGVYEFTQVQRAWNTDTGADRYRRGVYTYLQRSAPYPALTVFDAPDGTSACTRRIRSNTPLQALTLLNDQAFMEMAEGLASRVQKESLTDGEGIRQAFRLCLVRVPTSMETNRLEQYFHLQIKEYQVKPADAQALLEGESPVKGRKTSPPSPDVARRAAWVALARVLLNLDEFITRE